MFGEKTFPKESPLIVSVSGVRGIVGESLTLETVLGFSAVLGRSLTQEHGLGCKALVAGDGRPSGEALRMAAAAGLAGQGCDVIDLGVIPTPTVGVSVREWGAAGAIQVTASHNSAPYNGLKLFHKEGRVYPSGPGKILAERFAEGPPKINRHDRCGRIQTPMAMGLQDPVQFHIGKALFLGDLAAIKNRKFRVLVDANGGSGGPAVTQLLRQLGVLVVEVGCEPNGKFVHEPEPTALNLKGLSQRVAAERVDLAVVVDPDCDRLALMDSNGLFIGEEYTLALATAHCLRTEPGPVVINLSTSNLTAEVAKRAKVPIYRSPVGEANVVDMMREKKATIGGEGNGGVIDPRIGWVRDPLAGIVRILGLLAMDGKSLTDWLRLLPPFEIVKEKLQLDRSRLDELAKRVEQTLPGAEVDRRDGIRLDWAGRWVQLRASNTEPIVRVIAEAEGLDEAKQLVKTVLDLGQAFQ